MKDVKQGLPKIGESVKCKVNFWRHGVISHTEEVITKYTGEKNFLGSPIFEIDTGDEAYAEVVSWERLENGS